MYQPTDADRDRLELLHEQVEDARRDCSCGVRGACDECGARGLPDSFYVASVNYDTLELTFRLNDLDPESEFARRANLSDDFEASAHVLESLIADGHDLETIYDATRYLLRLEDDNVFQTDAELKPDAE